MFVEAAEGIIARRHPGDSQVERPIRCQFGAVPAVVKRTRRSASSGPPGTAVAFVALRLSCATRLPSEFAGGEDERSRPLQETEHDAVALASAGAEAVRLETTLERADREVTEREADSAALVIAQLRELVAAVAARLPAP